MTDGELLELAAKAAGLDLGEWDGEANWYWTRDWHWNPLTNDGDALRLAVKLAMAVEISRRKLVWASSEDLQHTVEIKFDEATDPYAATRRAIVKAAAEIGKEMP